MNALQNHTFDSVKMLQWRNSKLDFSSLGSLQVSLALSPGHEALTRAPIAEDQRVLDHAARDGEVRDMAHGAAAVERLWDACQIPDYRRLAPAAHAELVTTLYAFLMKRGRIPDAWFAAQVDQADRVTGDIDTLSGRIAQIRTWTFVANRPDWLYDPDHWQGIAREVENKLSDALHERLTERFVDRRTSVLMRRLRENSVLNTEIGKTGEVIVEGHAIGRLDGFTFAPDAAEAGSDAKALQAAAQQVLASEIDARATKLAARPRPSHGHGRTRSHALIGDSIDVRVGSAIVDARGGPLPGQRHRAADGEARRHRAARRHPRQAEARRRGHPCPVRSGVRPPVAGLGERRPDPGPAGRHPGRDVGRADGHGAAVAHARAVEIDLT